MRYISIAKDDEAGVLEIVYQKSCQKQREEEEGNDKYKKNRLNRKKLISHCLFTSINYSIVMIKSNNNEINVKDQL
jgi:hypothetical protein